MTLWAIVPVKPLRRGKSRLAKVLTQDERTDLNVLLLSNTLGSLSKIPEIEQVLVVSRDPAALALAREHGARTVQEKGSTHLNVALARATVVAQKFAARGILILPIDLPLITSFDINLMIQKASDPPVVVIAPDRQKKGTNALLICPAGIIDYDFGDNSYERHYQKAKAVGARIEICQLASLSLDLDDPEDLKAIEIELQLGYE